MNLQTGLTIERQMDRQMEKFISMLLGVVEKLLNEHRALFRECDRHKQALIDGDIPAIEACVHRMSVHITKINELEGARQHLSDQVATELDVSPERVTASFLIERMDNKSAERLQALTRDLQSIVVDLANSNSQNRMLLQSSLHYLHKTMDIVASVTSQDSYGPKKSTQVGVRLFDVEA